MKQLLNISKERKSQVKPNLKQLFIGDPSDQEEDFIYDEQNYNEGDGPTDTEIRTYAQILGIKLPGEEDLLYIAKQCLNEPLPGNWYCDQDQRGEIIYVNKQTGEISFEHPCDEIFRGKVIAQRKKKIKKMKKQLPKISVGKSKANFIQNVFNMKEDGQFDIQKGRSQVNEKKRQRGSDIGRIFQSKQILDKGSNEVEQERQAILKRQKKKSVAPIQLSLLKEDEPKETKETKIKKSQIEVRAQVFQRRGNPEAIEEKKREIQQKVIRKYAALTGELDLKLVQSIKQMRKRESDLGSMEAELLKKNLESFEKKKKQIEMKVMLEHSGQIERKRMEADKQHRLDLIQISSKYQIDGLFSEMASCRNFISRPRGEREKGDYLEEMEKNAKLINKIEIEKSVAQMQKQCSNKMHRLLSEVIQKKGDQTNTEQIYRTYTQIFEQFIEKGSWNRQIKKVFKDGDIILKEAQEQQAKNQSFLIFHELEQLKIKLKELQQDDGTHRSNLSEKQNKLFELLHNRVGNLTSRSSNYH